MPSPERVNLYQPAVLWASTGVNDRYGQPAVGVPVEIRVRWDDARKEMVDKDGNTVTVDASAVVAQDIAMYSRMRLGELAEWLGTGSALTDQGVMQVILVSRVPDIRNRFIFREVGLMRLRRV